MSIAIIDEISHNRLKKMRTENIISTTPVCAVVYKTAVSWYEQSAETEVSAASLCCIQIRYICIIMAVVFLFQK